MNDSTPTRVSSYRGRAVEAVQWKVSGTAPLEDLDGIECDIDDRVQMLSIYTVTKVEFAVDAKTGQLVKIQTLKPAEMHLMPFDENDPTDEGIIRAIMPGVVTSQGTAGDEA